MPKKVKLPKVFRRTWLAMLRSGRYKQTSGSNKREDGRGRYSYCCLGVACRAAGAPANLVRGSSLTSFRDGLFDTGAAYAKTIREVSAAPGFGGTQGLQSKLITLNDDKMWPFKKIATYIAQHTVGV